MILISLLCIQIHVLPVAGERFDTLRNTLHPIESPFKGQVYNKDTSRYLSYYNIDFPADSGQFVFGTMDLAGYKLPVQFYIPKTPRAIVIVLHGYQNHAGTMKNLITHLVTHNYAVACYDLPGYGLASDVHIKGDFFGEYLKCYTSFVNKCTELFTYDIYTIGFSMSGGVVAEALITTPGINIKKAVLAAPLVRSQLWTLSKMGHFFANPFFKIVPRIFRNDSSDHEFLRFQRSDPLETRVVQADWVRSLFEYEKRMVSYPETEVQPKTLILQGTSDIIVEWKYNLKILTSKIKDVKVTLLPGANHQLFNESVEYREKALDAVTTFFEE
ncbi:MAG: alpha/beta fold hydrolase [Elusimicrobiota bacterium]